jgi:hypothetical protein
MELEAVTAVLRPRNPWEAMDLGIALARRWWRPLYRAWFLVLLPLVLLLHLLCIQALWLVPWLLWWLKPLLDRIPLYILSHTLFGEVPGIRQTLRALPGLLSRQVLVVLTFGRLDPARSFHLPVMQLEGLRGRARRQRQWALDAQQRGAVWLTVTCAHLELAVDLGLVALVWLMLPDFMQLHFRDLLEDTTVLQQLWINSLELCGLSLIEPFYVAAGFALYLNRRTWLEAWDIEVGFRRLARRLPGIVSSGAVATLAITLWLALTGLAVAATGEGTVPPTVSPACEQWFAQQSRLEKADSEVKRTLATVLQAEALRHCVIRSVWRFKGEQQPRAKQPAQPLESPLAALLANGIEIAAWVALVVLLAAVLWRLGTAVSTKRNRPQSEATNPPPQPWQGEEAFAEIPAGTVSTTAWRLWEEGQRREALSLLYRNSLAELRMRYGVELDRSATEDECLRMVAAYLPGRVELLGFFSRLTRAWQSAAYAHRPPAAPAMQQLCEQWRRHFPS